MSRASEHDNYLRQILAEVASGKSVSQRSLAKQMGIALGLTNLLLKRLIREGWIRMSHIKPNRFAYLITQAGIAEKARMSRDYVARSMRSYVATRDRILESFSELSAEWPIDSPVSSKRVIFFGAGEIAEIGYVCLQATDLTLVGLVDEVQTSRFFGMPVRRLSDLSACKLANEPFDRLIVMALENPTTIERVLESAAVPSDAVFWLRDW